ncbi:glucomannan 4-beta-mannosyltransferase 9-like protein [Trifolium pratense]|uniref:Glucomannan 4-beta-mannosyltransferase 9-like protein n=1 Tax=Trifolium pratense TaxID=57577 RepID=A0A2K3K0D7_TRIPR|nr:glucomannan 4-beta-mannosyltransferase 9-like protein [Trifolium pratense]
MEAFQVVIGGVGMQIEFVWKHMREALVVPILKIAVFLCICMLLMDFVEKVYMAIVISFVKLCGRKPEKRYKWETIKDDDVELGNSNYPMVLVQIPMYNEREVYKLSIGAACGLSWPSDRIIIQILDDSTDPAIQVI